MTSNITWHRGAVSREQLETRLGQRGCVVWLTGLSASGKSTIARALELELFGRGFHPAVLDGDNMRHGLCSDLGFSPQDRAENIRRVAHVAALFGQVGIITLTAFISPYREDRARAKEIAGADRFLEVFLDADVETCARRDPKGLYRKALAGELKEFTGVSAPYEPPEDPALVLRTAELSVADCVERSMTLLENRGFIAPGHRR